MPQKIIIIGATSGIGRKLAELYAQKGYTIGATGRRQELLNSLKNDFPAPVQTECFDVTGNSNVHHLQSLTKKLDGLDLLIISAGGGEASEALDWQLDKWMVDTNVNGFAEIANWTFNYFLQQGHGQLITLSSVAAYRGNGNAPAYSAAKAFQSIYFEGLALKAEKLNKDIKVTCIEPGFVATKMAQSDKLFWVVPLEKAARQIIKAIEHKKRKAYISKRWGLIVFLLKWLPFGIYKRLG